MYLHKVVQGFPSGTSGKEPACQCRRHKIRGFDPWVRKIPWNRKWQFAPVILSWAEEPGWLQSMESQRVGHDWAHTHTQGCTAWWFDIHVHCETITITTLINTPSPHIDTIFFLFLCVCVCVCVVWRVRTLRIYPLSRFQIFDIIF